MKRKTEFSFAGQLVEWKGNGVYFWSTNGMPYQYAWKRAFNMEQVEKLLKRNIQLIYLTKNMLKTIKF